MWLMDGERWDTIISVFLLTVILEKVRTFDWKCNDKVMICQDRASSDLSGNPDQISGVLFMLSSVYDEA